MTSAYEYGLVAASLPGSRVQTSVFDATSTKPRLRMHSLDDSRMISGLCSSWARQKLLAEAAKLQSYPLYSPNVGNLSVNLKFPESGDI